MLVVQVVCGLIKKFQSLTGDDKIIGKSRRNVQLALVMCRQFNIHPFSEDVL
jgi:hypothetical protein